MDSKYTYEPYLPCTRGMTVRSRNAFLRAEVLAIQWAEIEISDCILSIALLRDSSAVATTTLISLGLPIEQIIQMLSESYTPHERIANTNITVSEKLRACVEQAHSVAREHGVESTETTHLLLVFARDPDSAFSKALIQLNLSRAQVIDNSHYAE